MNLVATIWASELAAWDLVLLEPRDCCGFPDIVGSAASVTTT